MASTHSRGIRQHPLGTNGASVRYRIQQAVGTNYRDLVWFIVHTGFANIRRPSDAAESGEYVFTSLEIAWQLFDIGYEPMFVMGRNYFVIIPTREIWSIIQSDDVLHSPFDTGFRPPESTVSVDSLIIAILNRDQTKKACEVHRAIGIVFPMFDITRSTVTYRLKKIGGGW